MSFFSTIKTHNFYCNSWINCDCGCMQQKLSFFCGQRFFGLWNVFSDSATARICAPQHTWCGRLVIYASCVQSDTINKNLLFLFFTVFAFSTIRNTKFWYPLSRTIVTSSLTKPTTTQNNENKGWDLENLVNFFQY